MSAQVIKNMQTSMDKALEALRAKLTKVRTGRASVALLDGIQVEAYGSPMPLNQVATLSVPEPRMLALQPWDKSLIPHIEKAILKSSLGLTPSTQGELIRIPVPALTEDRRKDLVKGIKGTGEEAKVAIRNARRDAKTELDALKAKGTLPEDDHKKLTEQVQKLTDGHVEQVDQLLKKKETEIMEV